MDNFTFVGMLGEHLLKEYEKSVLIKLSKNDGTCFIPICFVRTSKKGEKYISLPSQFKCSMRVTDYNKDTKERTLIEEREIGVEELKELF